MALIKISPLQQIGNDIEAAFYFQIDPQDQLASAKNRDRQPTATNLNPGEIQLLQDGKIYEQIASITPSAIERIAIEADLETKWNSMRASALANYIAEFSPKKLFDLLIGSRWDGNNWSKP